jgi:hypothetical protein
MDRARPQPGLMTLNTHAFAFMAGLKVRQRVFQPVPSRDHPTQRAHGLRLEPLQIHRVGEVMRARRSSAERLPGGALDLFVGASALHEHLSSQECFDAPLELATFDAAASCPRGAPLEVCQSSFAGPSGGVRSVD